MKFLKFLLLPFLIVFLLQIFFALPFWATIEHHATDIFFLIRGDTKITEDVVIVEIGDNTFNALDEQWPFPRQYYAKLIENLNLAGAKVVLFDIEFTETSNWESDERLAKTAEEYGNVIFAGKYSSFKTAHSVSEQIIPPVKSIMHRGLDWGTVNISSDTDGFVRRYQLYQEKGDKKYYLSRTLSKKSL